MICPKCAAQMKSKKVDGVTIDECTRCKGLWFDKGEIADVAGEIDPDLRWMDFDFWNNRGEFKAIFAHVKCPKGHTKDMVTLFFKQPAAKLSFCPICKGIWISKDNFLAIIQQLINEANSKSVAEYASISLKEASDIIAHPTQMLSEWRDLKTVLRLLEYRFFSENPKLKSVLEGIQKSLPL